MPNTFSNTGTITHQTLVAGLANGNTYNYYVRCKDSAGNVNSSDYTISFSVANPIYSKSDLNQDSMIDANDFNILKSDFSKTTAQLANPRSDIDGDGTVTIKDVGIMMSEWKP